MQVGDATRSPTAAVDQGQAAAAAAAEAGARAESEGGARVGADMPATPWGTRLAVVAIVALTVSPIVVAAISPPGCGGTRSATWPTSCSASARSAPGRRRSSVPRRSSVGRTPAPWSSSWRRRCTGSPVAHPRSLFLHSRSGEHHGRLGHRRHRLAPGPLPPARGLDDRRGGLIHVLTPPTVVSIWNPFLPLVPFLLAIALTWDVALGHRRSVLWLAVTMTVIAAGPLRLPDAVGAAPRLAGGMVRRLAASRGAGASSRTTGGPVASPRPRPGTSGAATCAGPRSSSGCCGCPWPSTRSSTSTTRSGSPGRSAACRRACADRRHRRGRPVRAPRRSVARRPRARLGALGAGVWPAPVAAGARGVGWLPWAGWRRRLLDVVALAALALAVVVGSVPATSQIYLPAYVYQTQFLKVVRRRGVGDGRCGRPGAWPAGWPGGPGGGWWRARSAA